MKAVIISIGDELVLGQNVDTNSAWLSERLARSGVMTLYHETIADDLAASVDCIRRAAGAVELVIITGGLGPTQDDLTREALAKVLNVPLDVHEDSVKRIEQFFRKIGRPMVASNLVQARYPRGTEMLANDWGTAPGVLAKVDRAKVFTFPGVPREMMPMFERYVEPGLQGASERTILTEALRTFGAGESSLAEKLGDLMRRDRNPTVGTTAASGWIVTVRVRSDFSSKAEAERELAKTVKDIEGRLGSLIFGRGDTSLGQVVAGLLRGCGRTVGSAEMFSGGQVARMMVDAGLAGDLFRGGWVAGDESFLASQMGIDGGLVRQHGVASEHVTCAMAKQVVERTGADYGLAVGGAAEAGSVWVGLAKKAGRDAAVRAEMTSFSGAVDLVRDRIAKVALNMIRLELLENIR